MRLAALFLFLTSLFTFAQNDAQPSSPSAAPSAAADDPASKPSPELQAIVHKQFGPDFEIAWKKSSGTRFKYRVEAK